MSVDVNPYFAIAIGEMPGFDGEYKFGNNVTVGTTEATIWQEGGLYSFSTGAAVMTISSSSADDDAGTGQGAFTAEVFGLDALYKPIQETLTLDGQTGVSTSNAFLRVFRIIVRSAGTNLNNQGILYVGSGSLTSGKPANVYGLVGIGENQTLQSEYTIPADKKGYLISMTLSAEQSGANNVTFRLKVRPENEVFQVKDKILLTENTKTFERKVALELTPKTDVMLTAQASAGSSEVNGSFEVVLKDIP